MGPLGMLLGGGILSQEVLCFEFLWSLSCHLNAPRGLPKAVLSRLSLGPWVEA